MPTSGDHKPGEDQLLDDFDDEARTAAAENAFGRAGGRVCGRAGGRPAPHG